MMQNENKKYDTRITYSIVAGLILWASTARATVVHTVACTYVQSTCPESTHRRCFFYYNAGAIGKGVYRNDSSKRVLLKFC